MNLSMQESVNPTIRLGISTCPNDTFTFRALIDRCVDWQGLEFEIDLLDIQQLNNRLFDGAFDVAKTSFHAALLLSNETIVLSTGSALGFGVGPLLLASQPRTIPTSADQKTLCPGEHTTAALLFALFYSGTTQVEHCVFSDIMPRLKEHNANFGVCIHEGRFTWEEQGLSLVEDLGTRWETTTGCPLPLGGLVANRGLGSETIAKVQSVIQESLALSLADPESALPTMRKYAQEFSDDVLMQHVDLYVNEWTQNLGETGATALRRLSGSARSIGLVPAEQRELEIWRPE